MAKLFSLLVAAALLMGASAFAAQDQYVRVQIKGVLHNDASGHRATIDANGATYRLDFGRNDNMFRLAERYDRSSVLIDGSLQIAQRPGGCPDFFVMADRLEPSGPASTSYQPPPQYQQPPQYEQPPAQQPTTIIRERERAPMVKLPGIEINP